MTDSGSRRGAANLTPILMILSFAAMGGFLWWLGMTAEGSEQVVMEESEDTTEVSATMVGRNRLRVDTDSLVGVLVRVEDVPVASGVGPNAFMVELGSAQESHAFLVVLDSALIASGRGLPQDTATVVGTVRIRTDSLLEAWIQNGIVPEQERPLVEFSSHFIEARRIQGPGMEPPGEGAGDGEGAGGGEGGEAGGGAGGA